MACRHWRWRCCSRVAGAAVAAAAAGGGVGGRGPGGRWRRHAGGWSTLRAAAARATGRAAAGPAHRARMAARPRPRGDDGSGVGSGGTGVSTADATGIGAVDGAGSIIVNGLRYDTDTAVVNVEDAPALQLGMSVKVTGPVNADFTSGTARRVDSAADIRGPLSSVDLAQGSFVILGTTVTTDNATVWADATGLAAIAPGHDAAGLGLAGGAGRAARDARRTARPVGPFRTDPHRHGPEPRPGEPHLHARRPGRRLQRGDLSGSLDGRPLANGTLVRVRANAALPGRLPATLVQWWYPVPTADAAPVQLAGVDHRLRRTGLAAGAGHRGGCLRRRSPAGLPARSAMA